MLFSRSTFASYYSRFLSLESLDTWLYHWVVPFCGSFQAKLHCSNFFFRGRTKKNAYMSLCLHKRERTQDKRKRDIRSDKQGKHLATYYFVDSTGSSWIFYELGKIYMWFVCEAEHFSEWKWAAIATYKLIWWRQRPSSLSLRKLFFPCCVHIFNNHCCVHTYILWTHIFLLPGRTLLWRKIKSCAFHRVKRITA